MQKNGHIIQGKATKTILNNKTRRRRRRKKTKFPRNKKQVRKRIENENK